MEFSVKYFASMRERMGCADQAVDLDVAEITVAELWEQKLSDEPLPANTLVAVNMEYCSVDTPLKDGDEVAFFPPVTGG